MCEDHAYWTMRSLLSSAPIKGHCGRGQCALWVLQGNWREMRAVLEARPELKTATGQAGYCSKEHYGSLLKKLTVPELMILDLFNSTCFPCLSGW